MYPTTDQGADLQYPSRRAELPREGYAWQVAAVMEDVAAIDAWLEEAAREGLTAEAGHHDARRQEYTWTISDEGLAGACTVSYCPQRPGVLALSLLREDPSFDPDEGSADRATLDRFTARYGAQPRVVSRTRGEPGAAESRSVTYGAVRLLDTLTLTPALFRPVLDILDQVVKQTAKELGQARAARPAG